MRIGSVLTLGYGPHGKPGLLPTIGYALGAAPIITRDFIPGADDEITEIDRVTEWRKRREDEMILGVIRKFLSTQ